MISRTEFVNVINKIIEWHDAANKISDGMRSFSSDVTGIYFDRTEEVIVNLLENMFEDKQGWISYCLYELNDFKNYKDGCVTISNGENIPYKFDVPLRNAGDLYDLLTSDMKDNNR